MTEAFKGAARLEKQQDKIDNKIKELDKKIAEIKQEADKQQQKIDDANAKIKNFVEQQKGLNPQDTLVIALQKQILQQREKIADAKELLKIYQTELQNLQNEKEEALKKKEKLTENYNEKVDEDSAKKLKEFLWGKFGDEEITRAFLEQKFTQVQEKIQEILGDQDQLSVWKKAMENAKTLEEKQELAIVFEKMQLLAQAHEAEKAELTKQVKAALGHLESSVIVSQAYDTADANKLEKKSDFDQKIDKTHKEARWARKKIFEQFASKDADMKLKLSFQEKKIMRQFAGIVNDVENWTRAEKKDENLTFTPSVEKVILDYIHSNPEQAARNTDEQWISALQEKGLVIKQESRAERRLGARGTTYLKEFAQYYAQSFNLDQTQDYTAGKNIRKYFDMVRQSGGFEGMLATYWDAAESSREVFKDKERASRLAKRLEKADPKTDSDLLNLFVDFNLDGTVAHGDSGLKSGLQIHSLYERLAGNDEAEQAKIIDNILAATNKANGLEGETAITRENAKSIEQLDKIQTLLKNPPVDVRYILQYGAEATDKFIADYQDKVQITKTPAEEQAFNEAVDKGVEDVEKNIKEAKQQAEKDNDQEALQVLNELEKLPREKLRLGLAQVLEGQVMGLSTSRVGGGVNIPLEKLLKGLSFNLGATIDKSGKPNLGINLARNGSVDLSDNGRFKAFGGANAGTTLATIPVLGATAGLGYTFENKKMDQSLTNRSEKTVSAGGHVIWSPVLLGRGGSIGIDRDLNRGRLEQEKNILNSISTVTADLLTKGAVDGKFTADPSAIEAALKERYGKTKKEDMAQAVQNLTSYLKMYEGAEINAATTQLISEESAKAYSLAWSNLQVQKLDQKGWYLSGGGLSVTFFAGVIPVVGILKFANHRFAGTADDLSLLEQVKKVMKSDEYNKELEGWVDVNIAALEKQLGVSGIIEAHKTEKDLLVINAKLAESANILLSPAIKGNIKLENGNLLIHKDTPVRALAAHLADRKVATLDIGAQTSAPDAKILNTSTLESLKAEGWFTEDVIDVTKLPIAKAKLSVEKFNAARDELKKQLEKSDFKNSFDLNALTLTPKEDGQFQINYLGKTYDLPAGHHLLIDAKGQIKFEKMKNGENFKIILERFKKERTQSEVVHLGEKMQSLITATYRSLSTIKTNALRNVGHKQTSNAKINNILYPAWREWLDDLKARKEGSEVSAANAMNDLLAEVVPYIDQSEWWKGSMMGLFHEARVKLIECKNILESNKYGESEKKQASIELRQLLFALDIMFSRTTNVVGKGDWKYKLQYWGQEVSVDVVANDVNDKIANKLERSGIWINKLYAADIKAVKDKLNGKCDCWLDGKEVQTEVMVGYIGYVFGNPDSIQRAVLSPEIVKWALVTEKEQPLNHFIKVDILKKTFQENAAFVYEKLENLRNQLGGKISMEELQQKIIENIQKWIFNPEYTLAIEWKNIKMSSDFVRAYCSQCINYTLLHKVDFSVEGWTLPSEDGEISTVDTNEGDITMRQRFEASIRGSQVALADAESKLRDTNDTQRFGVAATIAKIKSDEPEEVIKKNEVETDPNDGSTNDSDNSKENPGDTGPGDGSEWTPIPPKTPDTAPVPWDNPETPDHNIKEEGTPPASPADETDDF